MASLALNKGSLIGSEIHVNMAEEKRRYTLYKAREAKLAPRLACQIHNYARVLRAKKANQKEWCCVWTVLRS